MSRISLAAAQELFQAGQLKVVDIRDLHSFQQGTIQGAEHLDNSNLMEFITTTPKEQAILVCCYSGMNSQGAAEYLKEQGFAEVYSLDGGFNLWQTSFPNLCS